MKKLNPKYNYNNVAYFKIDLKKREKLVPIGKLGLPKDISSIIDYLLSDQADFIYGQVISISGGNS